MAESDSAALLDYFKRQTALAQDRLYGNGWVVQGVVRALRPLARLYVLRLAAPTVAGSGLPFEVVGAWGRPTRDAKTRHTAALTELKALRILEIVKDGATGKLAAFRLHAGFAQQLLDCLCVGGVLAVDTEDLETAADAGDGGGGAADAGGPSSGHARVTAAAPTLADLEQYAQARWERVLQFILTPRRAPVRFAMKLEGATLQELLSEADLVLPVDEEEEGDEGGADGEGEERAAAVMDAEEAEAAAKGFPKLTMSMDAARVLLEPTSAQVWRLVRAYMELAERGTKGTRHATLCFMMRLGLLEVGRGYRLDDPSLDELQRATLSDMARLGLVFIPKKAAKGGGYYYATPLAQHLLAGGGAAAGSTAAAGPARPSAASGFLVLETNFRLYAYTASHLWAQVLGLFTRIEYVLPNLVVGNLTRDSIHAALARGVSSHDVQAFIERNAHPRMAKLTPVLPETVVNQIHLWARDRKRLKVTKAKLYEQFTSEEEFVAVEKYAKDQRVLLWSRRSPEGHKCALAVKHDPDNRSLNVAGAMKKFIMSLRTERLAAPSNPQPS